MPNLISLVPAGTNNFAIYPSSCTSNPTDALSVSISQITSPGFTLSPSFTDHFMRFPFSIVGDNAGNPSLECLGKVPGGIMVLGYGVGGGGGGGGVEDYCFTGSGSGVGVGVGAFANAAISAYLDTMTATVAPT